MVPSKAKSLKQYYDANKLTRAAENPHINADKNH